MQRSLRACGKRSKPTRKLLDLVSSLFDAQIHLGPRTLFVRFRDLRRFLRSVCRVFSPNCQLTAEPGTYGGRWSGPSQSTALFNPQLQTHRFHV